MEATIGTITTYFSGTLLLITGLIYLFRTRFMPYHSVAIEKQWEEVDKKIQVLIIALMRAVSGGFIAVALSMAYLQYKFSTEKITWIPLLILVSGLLCGVLSLYATLIVRKHSSAKPPTMILIIGIISLVIGYLFNIQAL